MAENRAAELNGGDDEDEAIRIAIAMSLGQDLHPRPTSQGERGDAIDLTQDDDDETASEAESVVEAAPSSKPSAPAEQDGSETASDNDDGPPVTALVVKPNQPPVKANQPPPPPPPSNGGLSAFGIDRKKMEEERLARRNALKRKASSELEPSDSDARSLQRQKISSLPSSQPRATANSLQPSQNDNGRPRPAQSIAGPVAASSPLPFPKGAVKKTWAAGQPRLGDDIKIEEVLQKDKLELAVISSFQWDDEWMMSKLDIRRTKVILVAFATGEAQREEMRSNVPRDRIHFCFPPMQPVGSMHSKLQLLKYDGYLRIVVPTGNMVPYDWGETGGMENMVFLIDLPKLGLDQQPAKELPPFGEDLCYFLSAQGLDETLIKSLRKYDFSATAPYGFVHSIVGSHSGDAWKRTGYCGLGRAVKALNLSSKQTVELDYVCASLGAINPSLLKALYYACQGDIGLKEYESRTTGRKGKDTSTKDDLGALEDHIRVYFPSQQTVAKSRGGKNGAGTICFQSRWYNSPTFPKGVLRDCKSTRDGLLMHSKVIYVRQREPNHGFAYVGSANLSESAWGRLVKDRSTGSPKITCRNWECGVLISAGQREEKSLTSSSSENTQKQICDWGIFKGDVPVPMEVPGVPLSENSRKPWFYQDV
ncbi:tyrosyl-DNA phosphodiesterase-domain-containing protein [Cercophora scortea]|uniref:Tyrosyl-DNA phosphodiesterase-domain-containing protein n=1 Tax=Cercophora scortea TaxID=314031 RepID=A0AAE0IYI3_9PEZI|nr:tyrosyl-DNA phosphodiesterase-domain-containing protein [Cercophora scortea]